MTQLRQTPQPHRFPDLSGRQISASIGGLNEKCAKCVCRGCLGRGSVSPGHCIRLEREYESMGRIFVARHGESEANVRRVFDNRVVGLPLTPRGREQAAAMA